MGNDVFIIKMGLVSGFDDLSWRSSETMSLGSRLDVFVEPLCFLLMFDASNHVNEGVGLLEFGFGLSLT